MDFSLSPEQTMLSQTAHDLAAQHFGHSVAHAAARGDRTGPAKGWSALADSGLISILLPSLPGEAQGGLLEACIVLTELSAALAPVPFLTSAIAVPLLIRAYPGEVSDVIAAELARGQTFGLIVDQKLGLPAASPDLYCLGWEENRPGLLIAGEQVTLVDDIQPAATIDLLDPAGLVASRPDAVRAQPMSLTPAARRALAGMRTAVAAGLAGLVGGCARLAWDHIRQRQQYGRTLSSFQAVKHMAADLLVDVETCRSVTYGAAWIADNADVETAERNAQIAKAWCGQAAVRSAETAMQLLGGVGVTWESTAHLYLRKARLWSALLGDVPAMTAALGAEFIATRGRDQHGSA
jgi:alkylation response protein AidB-like acyl-CoA dehydrogenase